MKQHVQAGEALRRIGGKRSDIQARKILRASWLESDFRRELRIESRERGAVKFGVNVDSTSALTVQTLRNSEARQARRASSFRRSDPAQRKATTS